MATTNPVFQVLLPTGDQSPLAAGNRVDDLAVGQIGVFNYHTGLSVNGSVPGDCRDIFLAVGIDPLSTGSLADINKSAGQVIQVRNAKSFTLKGYVDALPKIIELTGFKAKCETDYILNLEFRNQKSYGLNGYNQFKKSYSFTTGCCTDDCATCPEGDCNELAIGMAAAINADADALATASLIANAAGATVNTAPTADGTATILVGATSYDVALLDADTAAVAAGKIADAINAATDTPYFAWNVGAIVYTYQKATGPSNATYTITVSAAGGTGITVNTPLFSADVITDTDAFIAANPGVCLGIRITGATEAINSYCSVNLEYYNPRGINIIASLVEGFLCNGTLTTIQELQYSEGKGYDIKHLEYIAGGWNGKPGPYRLSELTGTARGGFESLASVATNYNTISLTYDQMSVGGWLEYLNNLETIIAIPCADTTTLTDLVDILDAIFATSGQFGVMANDAALMDCTNVATHTINNPTTDGIESLS